MKTMRLVALLLAVAFVSHEALAGLQVEDTGGRPAKRKIIITSAGVFKAEVWQANSGGISKFYDLAADPEAGHNLAKALFEVGWHGAWHSPYKGPDGKVKVKKDRGALWWPWRGVPEETKLKIVEKTPARVRVHVDSVFVPYRSSDKGMKVDCTYTFYPTGRIAIRMHITKTGPSFHWSREYGPHLFVINQKTEDGNIIGFVHGTPKYLDYSKDARGVYPAPPSEELSMAYSTSGIKTTFFITIPPEEHKVFSRHMRHTFSGQWDRFGYGSRGVVMPEGYDATWTCMIQMGTPGSKLAPDIKTPKDAMPYAMQYREPARITGATLVKNDPGDFNTDGYNESEGCHVLRGPGPLAFTYERGQGAGFAPAFKVVGWVGGAPKSVRVDGKTVNVAAGVVKDDLVLQILARTDGEKVSVEIKGGAGAPRAATKRETVVFLNAESASRAKNWSGQRSTEHVSQGKYAMKRVFKVIKTEKGIRRPSLSVYGGFPLWPCDLTPYSEMKLDVYNPQKKTYKLQCAFKDKYQYSHKHYYGMADVPRYPDGTKPARWGGIVHLEVKPGWNHLSFSLDEIKKRTGIEWSYIHHYWMWLPEIEEDATLYFDNMRLVRRQGETGKLSPLWSRLRLKEDDKRKILYSFDSRYELWQWDWSGRKYIVTKPGVTEGTGAMQVHFGDLGPKKWDYSARFGVGLASSDKRFKRNVWTGYKRLSLDVHNPSQEVRDVQVTFTTRIDKKQRKEAHRSVKLQPGDNTLSFDLARLAADALDLANVSHFNLVPKRLADGTFGWLVLDNMRLTKD